MFGNYGFMTSKCPLALHAKTSYENNNKLGNVSKDRVEALKTKLDNVTASSEEMSKDLDITTIEGTVDTPTSEMQTIMDGVKTDPTRYQVLTHRQTASGNTIDVYFDATTEFTFVKFTDQDGKVSYIKLDKNQSVNVTANADHNDWYMTNLGFKDGKPYILLTDAKEAKWAETVLKGIIPEGTDGGSFLSNLLKLLPLGLGGLSLLFPVSLFGLGMGAYSSLPVLS